MSNNDCVFRRASEFFWSVYTGFLLHVASIHYTTTLTPISHIDLNNISLTTVFQNMFYKSYYFILYPSHLTHTLISLNEMLSEFCSAVWLIRHLLTCNVWIKSWLKSTLFLMYQLCLNMLDSSSEMFLV